MTSTPETRASNEQLARLPTFPTILQLLLLINIKSVTKLVMASTSTASYGTLPSLPPEDPSQPNPFFSRQSTTKNLRKLALLSGICYLVIIACGMTAEVGIRGSMIDFDDVQATTQKIQTQPILFRTGMMLDLVMSCADVCVAVAFAFLLVMAGANPYVSILSSVFRLMQQAVVAANLLNIMAASVLLDPNLHASLSINSFVSKISQQEPVAMAMAMLFLTLHKYGYALALLFFGVSMCLLSAVILSSDVMPKWLGLVVGTAGVGYLADNLLFFLKEGYDGEYTPVLMLGALVAEFGLTFWLLVGKPRAAK